MSANIKVEIKDDHSSVTSMPQECEIWEAEDRAACAMGCEAALEKFQTIVRSLKASIADNVLTPDTAAVSVLMLKELNRRAHFRNKAVQELVGDAQRELALKHLQLQNKKYEVLHLQKEIKKCLEFRSGDEAIELISMEEFLQTAPEEYRSEGQSPHELQLNRLKYELEQRKALSHEHAEKVVEEKRLSDDIADLENSLSSLGPQLDALIEATKPVQEVLGRDFLTEFDQQRLAHILPEPLYSLYAQLHAYVRLEKSMNVKVSILGDEKAVEEFVERHQHVVADEGELGLEASASPENRVVANEGDRLNGERADSADEEKASSPKHKKRRGGKGGKESTSPSLARVEVTCDPFPLDVSVEFKLDKSHLSITFWYFPEIHVVACWAALQSQKGALPVQVPVQDMADGNNVLCGLHENDTGDACASEVACALERAGKTLDEVLNGKFCYKWANRLCGIEVPQGEAAISYANTVDFVRRVFGAIRSREALLTELSALVGKSVPIGDRASAVLCGFKPITDEDAQRMLSSETGKKPLAIPKFCWVFEARMSSRTGASDESVLVFVPFNYPAWPPAAQLMSKGEEVREVVERKLNVELWHGCNGMHHGGILQLLAAAADALYARDATCCGRARKPL